MLRMVWRDGIWLRLRACPVIFGRLFPDSLRTMSESRLRRRRPCPDGAESHSPAAQFS